VAFDLNRYGATPLKAPASALLRARWARELFPEPFADAHWENFTPGEKPVEDRLTEPIYIGEQRICARYLLPRSSRNGGYSSRINDTYTATRYRIVHHHSRFLDGPRRYADGVITDDTPGVPLREIALSSYRGIRDR
jgi:hypothetical protein